MKTLFFSVIIPTYNRAGFISKTIDSFLQQTYSNFEIIVVDDGSTDNTRAVVEAIRDSRIKYYWKNNAERGAARNFGAARAKGDYLNFFDSDDIAYPIHLEIAAEAINKLNNPDTFHLGMEIKNENGKVERQIKNFGTKGFKSLLSQCYITPNAVFLKYNAWERVRFNETRLLSGSEDWVFFLQLSNFYDWIAFDSVITSCLMQHENRSMNIASGKTCYERATCLYKILKNDKDFIQKFSKKQTRLIFAEPIHLAALHYALEKKKGQSLKCLFEVANMSFKKIISRRTLAITKYLLLRW